VLTGSEGEFIIFRKADEPETGSEDENVKTKSGEQQP
jgi:hypothetical protein